jgi:hypothetical protein
VGKPFVCGDFRRDGGHPGLAEHSKPWGAAQAFDKTFDESRAAPETQEAAKELVRIAPAAVIKDLEARAENCWVGYRKVLGGPFLPDEIDKATVSVRACVCRELRRIHDINGGKIPDKWCGQWVAYDCAHQQHFAR